MADEVRLAIVGSVSFANPNAYAIALAHISNAVALLSPGLIVSGEADGIDTFAEVYARTRDLPFEGFPPANRRWEPDGFKDRNMRIAERCTHLLAIRCADSRTYGSGWTADYAEKALGRVVQRVVVPRTGGVRDA